MENLRLFAHLLDNLQPALLSHCQGAKTGQTGERERGARDPM